MNEADAEFLEIIRKFGWHVMQVSNAIGEEGPTFSYSTGIFEAFGAPEVIVFGLSKELEKSLINQYGDEIKSQGRLIDTGKRQGGFLEGFDVAFIEANDFARKEFCCWADWYYERKPFPLLQLIYPTTSGVWPWEERASEEFRAAQPLFGDYRHLLT